MNIITKRVETAIALSEHDGKNFAEMAQAAIAAMRLEELEYYFDTEQFDRLCTAFDVAMKHSFKDEGTAYLFNAVLDEILGTVPSVERTDETD